MTVPVSIYEAKPLLSELSTRVVAGEEVLIADGGKPVARPPLVEQPAQRAPGTAIGKITIAPDFDDPLPNDLLNSFEQAV